MVLLASCNNDEPMDNESSYLSPVTSVTIKYGSTVKIYEVRVPGARCFLSYRRSGGEMPISCIPDKFK